MDSVIPISVLLADFNTTWAMYASNKEWKGELYHDIGKLSTNATCVRLFNCLNVAWLVGLSNKELILCHCDSDYLWYIYIYYDYIMLKAILDRWILWSLDGLYSSYICHTS